MAVVVGEAAVRLRPDTSRFASEAQSDMSSTMPGIAKKAAGFFAAAFAAVKIGGFLTDAIGQASDLSETVNKSNVIFGDNAARIREWSQGAAQNFGLSRQAALDAAAGMGNMLQQLGFSGAAAADASTNTVKLAADLGSFNNLETGDVLDRIGAAMRGEYDSLQTLIPNINATRVEHEAMAATGKKNADSLTAQEKAAATLAIVQRDGAAAANDFAETSGGLANSTKIATAQFADMQAKVGEALLPTITDLMGFVSSTVIPVLGTVGETAGQAFNILFRGDFTGGPLEEDSPAVDTLFRIRDGFIALIGYVRDEVIPGFVAVGEAIMSTVQFFREHEGAATALGVVVGGVVATIIAAWVAQGAVSLIESAKSVIAWFATATASTTSATIQSRSTAQIVVGWLLASAQAAWGAARVVASWVAMAAGAVVSFGQTIAIMALYAAESVASAASAAASWVGAQLRTVASLAVMAAGFVVQGAVMLASVAVTVAGVVAGWVLMAAQSLLAAGRMAAAWFIALGPVGWVIAAVIGLVALIIANWETVKSWTIGAFQAIVGAVVGAFHWIVNGVSSGIAAVIGFVTGLPGRVLGALGNFGSLLLQKGRDLMQGLVDGIASAAGFVGNVARNIVNSVIGFVNGNIIDGINSLLEFTIAGITINPPDIPHIPRLHEGGYFTSGRAEGEGLALLRDAELVATPEQQALANDLLSQLLAGRLPDTTTSTTTATGASQTVHVEVHPTPGTNVGVLASQLASEVGWRLSTRTPPAPVPIGAGT